MDALTEREVLVVRAGDVQRVGIREPFRVVVRGRVHEHLAFRDEHPTDDAVFSGEAFSRCLHRTVVAQQSFDRRLDERGVVFQLLELIGVLQQRQHAVADEVDGGFVPSDQQQEHHGEQLAFA